MTIQNPLYAVSELLGSSLICVGLLNVETLQSGTVFLAPSEHGRVVDEPSRLRVSAEDMRLMHIFLQWYSMYNLHELGAD